MIEEITAPAIQEEEGVTSQEEDEDEVEEEVFEEEEEEEGIAYEDEEEEGESGDETDEGLEGDWEGGVDDEAETAEEIETGSMSPTDAMMDGPEDKLTGHHHLPSQDPICYHCGVALVDPPLRIGSEVTSPKISIPLHCEVCVRGIHSQCHISLGGSLPTQEESFVCFHCRTMGKYEMKAADRGKVSVGPAHQVPVLPEIFFASPTPVPLSVARNRFVQVWSAEAARTVIPNDRELYDYLHKASVSWPDRLRVNSTGGSLASGSVRKLYLPRAAAYTSSSGLVLNHYWCPFSPEYALAILHRCNYRVDAALAAVKNPALRDCFSHVCFPPSKPYYNKWKPKDRRWRMLKVPFPPSRIEAPSMDNMYEPGDGPRLRSRRYY